MNNIDQEQKYRSAADPPGKKDYQALAAYHIQVKLHDNIFSWAGEVLDLLKQCEVPPGRIVNIQKKFVQYLSNNDTRRTYAAGKMFRHIISNESGDQVFLKLLKENGQELK